MDFTSEISAYHSGSYTVLSISRTDSTNRHLDLLLQKKHHYGNKIVLLTDYQSEGRGMMGTNWQSEAGQNLLCSILLRPVPVGVTDQFILSEMTSLALVDCLVSMGISGQISIKWPNDILINEKKVCGILIQNSLKNGVISHSIIGIGLNINQAVFNLPEATSLFLSTGKNFKVSDVLHMLIGSFEKRSDQLANGSASSIRSDYLNRLTGLGKWAIYFKNGMPFEGKIVGVERDGRLSVENRNGILEKFNVKEIRRDSAP